jgi:hypothetical protein
MIKDAGLDRMFVYPDWLSKLALMAKENDEVLHALKYLRQIAYNGAAINPENE